MARKGSKSEAKTGRPVKGKPTAIDKAKIAALKKAAGKAKGDGDQK